MVEPYVFEPGAGPLLVTMPHVGTHLPDEIMRRLTPAALALPDNDWHVDALYDFLGQLGASVLRATHARYVVDLNRPPGGEELYPGQPTPGLVPHETFQGQPVWIDGQAPDAGETAARVARWWQPYHDRLAAALEEIRARHGTALLWEAHSIRSHVPRLFDGRLPDLNLGTGRGSACAPAIAGALLEVARTAAGYTAVLDGRFIGGYTTRHYGAPAHGVHAVQLELAQATYMDEDESNRFRPERAARLQPVLRSLLETFVARGLSPQ